MAEEHRCEAPEGHRLCANNCGFFGSPATMNLCSKCYGDIRLKEQEAASTKSTIETALSASATATASATAYPSSSTSSSSPPVLVLAAVAPSPASVPAGPVSAAAQPNRCSTCRKRVGLTGFRCRCGVTFCGAHRYPEKHGCGFDFKTVGREGIARANPVIKAEKLERI